MRVRRRYLPPGWYPEGAAETAVALDDMRTTAQGNPLSGIAGVVPHAGWGYSGALVVEVLSCLSRSMDTIVIIGGHLGPADGIVCLTEEAYDTPLGRVAADAALLNEIRSQIPMRADSSADNTVEVHLPMVRHLFPGAMALGLRAPPAPAAMLLGSTVADSARKIGRRVAVVGSTDLTHYGPGYGFAPAGGGAEAVRWVREVNDRRILDALLAMDTDAALDRAARERSACSVGGALAAITFARESGAARGTLVRYATSLDVRAAESFVGYAGILYS